MKRDCSHNNKGPHRPPEQKYQSNVTLIQTPLIILLPVQFCWIFKIISTFFNIESLVKNEDFNHFSFYIFLCRNCRDVGQHYLKG